MIINRSKLFRDAWAYAKAFAGLSHISPRSLIADALRKCWADAKALMTRPRQPKGSDRFMADPIRAAAVARRQTRLGGFCVPVW